MYKIQLIEDPDEVPFSWLRQESPVWEHTLQELHRHLAASPALDISRLKNLQIRESPLAVQDTIFLSSSCESSLDSLQDLAKIIELGDWSSLISARQSKGRGRQGKTWLSRLGNLYTCSIIPNIYAQWHGLTSLVVGYALLQALKKYNQNIRLKWPNDIISGPASANEQKIAGLLLEQRGRRIFAGIGINVLNPPKLQDFGDLRPAEMLEAASIFAEIPKKNINLVDLWREISLNFRQELESQIYPAKNLARKKRALIAKIEAELAYFGQRVKLFDNAAQVHSSGLIRGITANGALSIYTEQGQVKNIRNYSVRLAP